MSTEHYREDVLVALTLPPFERGRIAQIEDATERESEYLNTQVERVLQMLSAIEAYREMAKDMALEMEQRRAVRGRKRNV